MKLSNRINFLACIKIFLLFVVVLLVLVIGSKIKASAQQQQEIAQPQNSTAPTAPTDISGLTTFYWPSDVPSANKLIVESVRAASDLEIDMAQLPKTGTSSAPFELIFRNCYFRGIVSLKNTSPVFGFNNGKLIFENCRLSLESPPSETTTGIILVGTSSFIVRNSVIFVRETNGNEGPVGLRLRLSSITSSTTSILIANNKVEPETPTLSTPPQAAIFINLGRAAQYLDEIELPIGQFSIESNSMLLPFNPAKDMANQALVIPFIALTFIPLSPGIDAVPSVTNFVTYQTIVAADQISISNNYVMAVGITPDVFGNIFALIYVVPQSFVIFKMKSVFRVSNNNLVVNITAGRYSGTAFRNSGPVFSAIRISAVFDTPSLWIAGNVLRQFYSGFGPDIEKMESEVNDRYTTQTKSQIFFLNTIRSNITSVVMRDNQVYAEALAGVYGLYLSHSFSRFSSILFSNNNVKVLKTSEVYGIGITTFDRAVSQPGDSPAFDSFASPLPTVIGTISYLSNNVYYTRFTNVSGSGDLIKIYYSDDTNDGTNYVTVDEATERIDFIEVANNTLYCSFAAGLQAVQVLARVRHIGAGGIKIYNNDIQMYGYGNYEKVEQGWEVPASHSPVVIRINVNESITGPIHFFSNKIKVISDRGQGAGFSIDSVANPTGRGWGRMQDAEVFAYDNEIYMKHLRDSSRVDMYFMGMGVTAQQQQQSFGAFTAYRNNITIVSEGFCPFSSCVGFGYLFLIDPAKVPVIDFIGLFTVTNNTIMVSGKGSSFGVLTTFAGTSPSLQQTGGEGIGTSIFGTNQVAAPLGLCFFENIVGLVVTDNKISVFSTTNYMAVYFSLSGNFTKIGTTVVKNNAISMNNFVPSDHSAKYVARAKVNVVGIGCFSGVVDSLIGLAKQQPDWALKTIVIAVNLVCADIPVVGEFGDLIIEDNFVGPSDFTSSSSPSVVRAASLLGVGAAVNFTGDILIRNNSVASTLNGAYSKFEKAFPLDFNVDPGVEAATSAFWPMARGDEPESAVSRIRNLTIVNSSFVILGTSCSTSVSYLNSKPEETSAKPLVANPGLLNAPMYQIQNMKIDRVSVTFADVCQINPTRANTSKFTVFTFDRLASRTPLQSSSSSSQLPPARINITNFFFSISSSTAKDVGVNLINIMNTDSEKTFASLPQVVSVTLKNVSIFNTNYDPVNKRGSFSAHDQLYSVQNPTSIPSPLLQLVVPCTKWNDRFIFASDKVVKQSLPFPAVAPTIDVDIRYCMPKSQTRTETHLASRSQELTPSTSVSSSQSKSVYDKSVHIPTLPLSPGANTALSIGSAVTFPTAAQNAFKAIALTRLRACFNDSYRYQPLDVDSNILMLSLGQNDELTSYRGAVVGNLIFTFVIFLFFVSLSVGFLGVKRYLREKQIQKIREEKKRKQENDEELQQVLLDTNNININNSELNDASSIPEEMSFLSARELFRIPGVVFPVIIVVGMPSIMAVTVLATVPNHLDFDIVLSIPSIILFGIIFVGIGSWCAIKCDGSCGMKKRKTEQLIWTIEGFTQELKDRKKAAANNYIKNNRKDDTKNNNKNKYVKPPKLTKYEYELKERIYQKKKKKDQEELERVLENNPKSWPTLRAIWSFVYRIIAFAIFEPKEWKETSFVLQFGIMFDSYTMVIFCVIDYVTAALIAISSGISMTCSEVSCCNVAGSLAIVICFIYMLLILYFRPYLMRVERWMNCAMVVVTFISSCLVLAELNELGVTDILDGFAELSVALSFITVVFGMQPLLQSMFVVFWRMYKRKRREARRNGERRNGGGGGSNSWNIFGDSLGARRHRRLASLAGSDGGDGEEIVVVVPIARSQPRSLQSSAVPTRRSSVSKSTSSKSSPPTTLSSSSRKSSNLSQIKRNFDNNNNNTSREAVEISQLLLAPLPVRSSPKSVVSSSALPSSPNQQSRSRSGTRERENSTSSSRLPRNEYPGSNNNKSNHSSVRRNSSSSSPRSQKGSSSSVVRPSSVSNVRRSSTSSHNNNNNQEKEQMKTKQTIEAIQKKNQERFANL